MIGVGVAAFIFGFILLALGCIVAFTARFFKSCPFQVMTKDGKIIYKWCYYIRVKETSSYASRLSSKFLIFQRRKCNIERVFYKQEYHF